MYIRRDFNPLDVDAQKKLASLASPGESFNEEKLEEGLKIINTYYQFHTVKMAIWFTLIGLYSIYVLSTTAILFWKGWNSTHFKWKSRAFTFIASAANFIFVIHAMATEALAPFYPCNLRMWLSYYTVFYWTLSVHVRGLKYIYTVRINTLKTDLADTLNELEKHSDFGGQPIDNDDGGTKDESYSKGNYSHLPSPGDNKAGSVVHKHYSQSANILARRKNNTADRISLWVKRVILRQRPIDFKSLSLEEQYVILRRKLSRTHKWNFWLSDRVFLAIFALIAVIIAVACILGQRDKNFRANPAAYSCSPGVSGPMILLYAWIVANAFVIFPLLIYYCRGIHDAYGMRNELMVTLTTGIISLPIFLLYNEFVPSTVLVKVTGYIFLFPFMATAHWMLVGVPMLDVLREHRQRNRSYPNLPRASNSSQPVVMTRRERFELLLGSSEGFEKLADAARRTFCPENIDFLRDYQYLKWRVCYLVTSDGAVNKDDLASVQISNLDSGSSSDNDDDNTGTTTAKSNKQHTGQSGLERPLPPLPFASGEFLSSKVSMMMADSHAPQNHSDESVNLHALQTSPLPILNGFDKRRSAKGSTKLGFSGFANNFNLMGLGVSSASLLRSTARSGKNGEAIATSGGGIYPNAIAPFSSAAAAVSSFSVSTPLPVLSKNQSINNILLSDNSLLPLPHTIIKTLIKKRLLPSLNRLNGTSDLHNGDGETRVAVPKALRRRFRQFYSKYIEESAALCVNISQQVVKPIKASIECGDFTIDMFDRALVEVLELLYSNTFSQVEKSQ